MSKVQDADTVVSGISRNHAGQQDEGSDNDSVVTTVQGVATPLPTSKFSWGDPEEEASPFTLDFDIAMKSSVRISLGQKGAEMSKKLRKAVLDEIDGVMWTIEREVMTMEEEGTMSVDTMTVNITASYPKDQPKGENAY